MILIFMLLSKLRPPKLPLKLPKLKLARKLTILKLPEGLPLQEKQEIPKLSQAWKSGLRAELRY